MVAAAYFLVAAVALALVVRSVRTYYSLKQFGGHWSSGWSRLWLLNTQSSGEMHKRFAALNRKHGEFSTRAGFFLVTTALESRSHLPIIQTRDPLSCASRRTKASGLVIHELQYAREHQCDKSYWVFACHR